MVEDLAPDRDVSVIGGTDGSSGFLESPKLDSLGDYRILREVGRGGMGIVYEAEQVSLGRRVALKVLANQQLKDVKHKIRFQREARLAARLHHTNIVPVFGVGEEDGISYYVMQFIQGLGLHELLHEVRRLQKKYGNESEKKHALDDSKSDTSRNEPDSIQIARTLLVGEFGQSNAKDRNSDEPACDRFAENTILETMPQTEGGGDSASIGQLSSVVSMTNSSLSGLGLQSGTGRKRTRNYWDSVAQIGYQVASALQYAHEQSILHRDIKPSNLLLDNAGTVWVADFGLAKALDQHDLTQTGDILGTLRYMPPEAFSSKTDHRGDIYSLGITIYEMLTLQPAYRETDRHQLIAQVTSQSPERLDKVNPEIPRDLVTIVHKAIEREPSHRYRSAKELAADFDRFLKDEPIKARRVSATERALRWSRQNKGMAASFLLIAVLLTVGTIASTVTAFNFRQQKELFRKQKDIATEQEKVAKYSQYVANVQAAAFYQEEESTRLTRELLKTVPQEHRNWEWAYLAARAWKRFEQPKILKSQQIDPNQTAAEFWKSGAVQNIQEILPPGNTGGFFDGFFDGDGSRLLLALSDGSLGMFSIKNGELLGEFRSPNSTITLAGLSPDGKRLLTGAVAGKIELWDFEKKTRIAEQQGGYLVTQQAVVWTPDGKFIITAPIDNSIHVWDSESLKLIHRLTGHRGFVKHFHMTPGGDEFWSVSLDGTVRKWSLSEGSLISVRQAPEKSVMRGHVISPDGRIAVATFLDGSGILWDIEKETRIAKLESVDSDWKKGTTFRIQRAISFSPDGSCVAVLTGSKSMTVYNSSSGKIINKFEGHSSPIRCMRFHPNGRQLMTTSEDATAKFWTVLPAPAIQMPTLENAHEDVTFALDIHSSGKKILTGSYDKKARVWDAKTKALITTYAGHRDEIIAVDFNPDNSRAASMDAKGNIHVWDTVSGNEVFRIPSNSNEFANNVSAAGGGLRGAFLTFPAVLTTGLFSPDGSRLVVYQKNGMKVFDARDGTLVSELEDATEVGWAVFDHHSKLVAIIEMKANSVGIWNLQTGKLVTCLEGHSTTLVMIQFSPVDDRIVTAGVDRRTIVWNSKTGEQIHVLQGKSGFALSCKFSSDGRWILAACSDNLCRVWNSKTGILETTMMGHRGRARDLRIHPDGDRFLSVGVDNRAIVWDFAKPNANLLVSIGGNSRLLQAHWTPDGKDIVSSWSNGRVDIWSGATKEDLSTFKGNGDRFEEEFETWRKKSMRSTKK